MLPYTATAELQKRVGRSWILLIRQEERLFFHEVLEKANVKVFKLIMYSELDHGN